MFDDFKTFAISHRVRDEILRRRIIKLRISDVRMLDFTQFPNRCHRNRIVTLIIEILFACIPFDLCFIG